MEATANKKTGTGKFEKIAYSIFVLAGIYFLIRKDYSNAVVFWGLAPIFEPFDAKIPFGKRPLYQRIWLITHVIITLIGFVLLIVK